MRKHTVLESKCLCERFKSSRIRERYKKNAEYYVGDYLNPSGMSVQIPTTICNRLPHTTIHRAVVEQEKLLHDSRAVTGHSAFEIESGFWIREILPKDDARYRSWPFSRDLLQSPTHKQEIYIVVSEL